MFVCVCKEFANLANRLVKEAKVLCPELVILVCEFDKYKKVCIPTKIGTTNNPNKAQMINFLFFYRLLSRFMTYSLPLPTLYRYITICWLFVVFVGCLFEVVFWFCVIFVI